MRPQFSTKYRSLLKSFEKLSPEKQRSTAELLHGALLRYELQPFLPGILSATEAAAPPPSTQWGKSFRETLRRELRMEQLGSGVGIEALKNLLDSAVSSRSCPDDAAQVFNVQQWALHLSEKEEDHPMDKAKLFRFIDFRTQTLSRNLAVAPLAAAGESFISLRLAEDRRTLLLSASRTVGYDTEPLFGRTDWPYYCPSYETKFDVAVSWKLLLLFPELEVPAFVCLDWTRSKHLPVPTTGSWSIPLIDGYSVCYGQLSMELRGDVRPLRLPLFSICTTER